jgi:hypothetical protein
MGYVGYPYQLIAPRYPMNGAGDNFRVKFCQPDFKAIYHALGGFFVDTTTEIQPIRKPIQ